MSATPRISLQPLPDRDTLAHWWRDLEQRADLSFFTSWSWLGPWLELLPDLARVRLLVAEVQGRRVGLGLLVEGRARLLKLVPQRAWRLHTAGIYALDDLSIEYNDFLLDRAVADSLRPAMLAWVLDNAPKGLVEIRGCSAAVRGLAESPAAGVLARCTPLTAYQVSLDEAREAKQGYLSLISSNVRSQIRRSLKAYGALGEMTVHAAKSLEQAEEYLFRLRAMHTERWRDKGVHSGFARDPVAQTFHDRVVRTAFAGGEVQMLRVQVGEADLGYLYNYVYRGNVYYYQSGLNYALLDNKHGRPGLVCHTLAIDFNVKQGHRCYDLLAGHYRYKASLATRLEPMAHCVFQRDGALGRLDALARRMKRRTTERDGGPTHNAADGGE